MNIGIIGLGKMGQQLAIRLLKSNFIVFGFDVDEENSHRAGQFGVTMLPSVHAIVQKVELLWLMVPHGELIDSILKEVPTSSKKCIVVDGGNSHYKDSMRRSIELEKQGIDFLDCGTSGGLAGGELGFCLMIGGAKDAYEKSIPVFKALAAPLGYAHVGPSGAGHYIKMIHNGIEYALLESYAEGFNLLKQGSFKELDLAQIAGLWENGSIIRSLICTLSRQVFERDTEFSSISGAIGENATGAWSLSEAKEQAQPVPLIEESLKIRAWSRKTGGDWRTKLVAELRHQFGGHPVEKLKSGNKK
jgi:6-phosphogluconate dehydrogenase